MDAFSWFKTSYLISCINHKAITPGSNNRWCIPKFINEKVFITSWLIKPCFYSNLTMYQSIVYSSSILKWYFLKCIIFWQNTSWCTPLRLCITNIPITDQSCLNWYLTPFYQEILMKAGTEAIYDATGKQYTYGPIFSSICEHLFSFAF